jgi:hypothetical protein
MTLRATGLRLAALCGIALSLCADRSHAYVRGGIQFVPGEPPAERQTRHREVAERRARTPLIICHRGAASFAPENTLEAYAAAMDYGADGCEIDLRRTLDGILVLFHDDMLDHLTNGFGTVNRLTYVELLELKPRFQYGTATRFTRAPTFAAVLALARQRRMLLHLDVKETGLDADLAEMITEADAWDHIIAVNSTTAPELAKDSRWKPIRYKGPGLFDKRLDMDPAAVGAQLAQAGDAIMVDDPRVAVRQSKRTAYRCVPVPQTLEDSWFHTEATRTLPRDHGDPFLKEQSELAMLSRLEHCDPCRKKWTGGHLSLQASLDRNLWMCPHHPEDDAEERTDPDAVNIRKVDESEQNRTDRLLQRARHARYLGDGERTAKHRAAVITWLEYQVRHRSMHRDWMFHGLDGAIAARSLGDLGAVRSVPLLVETFKKVDPELKKVVDPRFAANPLAWTDFRLKMYILPALGKLPCPESKAFLQEYLAMPEAQAREIAPLQYEEAAKSLFRQKLSQAETETLLRSPNSAVRGTAVLECLDRPTNLRTAALNAAAPWALDLPRAKNAQNRR